MIIRGFTSVAVVLAMIGILVPSVAFADPMPVQDAAPAAGDQAVVQAQLQDMGVSADSAADKASELSEEEAAQLALDLNRISVAGAESFGTIDFLITVGVGLVAFGAAYTIVKDDKSGDGILE